MWYFVLAMVINGVESVDLFPVKDLNDCKQKATAIVEMIKKDPMLNQPGNTLILSCKEIKTS
jgi:hypothetical protein